MSTTICPHCAGVIKLIPLSGSGGGPSMRGGWERGQEFAFGAGKLPAGAAELSRERPIADMATITAGARLPLVQAMITSAAAMLLTVVACWWWELDWVTVPVVGVVVGCLSWYLLLIQSRNLLSSREVVTADPSAGEQAFSVEVTLPAEGRMLFCEFPGVRREDVTRFARSAASGRPTAESAGLSRSRFVSIREESLNRGLVRWRDPVYHTTGLEVTAVGRAAFSAIVDGLLD